MLADSSLEVTPLTSEPEPFCVTLSRRPGNSEETCLVGIGPVSIFFELRGWFFSNPFEWFCPQSRVLFLTDLPWSTLSWSLKMDPEQICRVCSLCSSLVLCPTYSSHLDLFSSQGDCWAPPGTPLPHTMTWEFYPGKIWGRELVSFVARLSGITVLPFPMSTSWNCCFVYFACGFVLCFVFRLLGRPEVNLVPVSPSWPDTEV